MTQRSAAPMGRATSHPLPYRPAAVTVAVAERGFLARAGIASVIDAADELTLAGVTDSVSGVGEIMSREPLDVVVLGPKLLQANRREKLPLLAGVRRQDPHVGVVMLGDAQPATLSELTQAGGAGLAYVSESTITSADRLVHTMLEVRDGNVVLESQAFGMLAGHRRSHEGIEALTPREHEVLSLIASGANNAAIAERLVLSERAIERHINVIYKKLRLHDDPHQHPRVAAVLAHQAHWRHAGTDEMTLQSAAAR